jgi:nucleoside-diphosphate-sugar epimerase
MLFEALRKSEIPAIRNPLNANDFIYNEDIAEAFHEAVNRPVPSGIYNLGSGSPTKVIDICEIIERRITGNGAITDTIRNRINCEPEISFWADTNKTSDVLRWKYRTSLEEGIAKYELSEDE